MQLLSEKYPVQVYRSSDAYAPQLDRNPNCVATILKACLVVGYGDKNPAGWTMPFQDDESNAMVFRPKIEAEQDFYLRISKDTGRELTAQVFLNMTDANTGELKLHCDTPFKYAIGRETSRKWLLLACGRAFWFFHETADHITPSQSASYFYCGDTSKNTQGDRAIYLKHTGGSWGINDTDRYFIFDKQNSGGIVIGKLFDVRSQRVLNCDPVSLFGGRERLSTHHLFSPVLLMPNVNPREIWTLPAFSPSTNHLHNFDEIQGSGRTLINFSTAIQYPHNFYVPIDYWEF